MASASFGAKPAGVEQLPQIDAVHKFHQEIKQPVGLAELVERDDMRMIEFGKSSASRVKRSAKPGPLAVCGGRIFSATIRSSCFLPGFIDRPMPP